MVRYSKKDLIDLKNSKVSIWKNWIVIAFILTFGFVNVVAEQRCCYSTSSEMSSTSVNSYKLNLTASHVDSGKAGNLYYVAISFQQGYSVIGDPYSPFSKITCTQTSGTIPQYNCQSRESKTFFVEFDLAIQPTPSPNSTITASSVYIFSDKCQNVAYCTDLAEKHETEDSDKISLGPLGTWPKYAVIIGGVILGITLLVACYLVYRRNRPDDRYRDRSTTPGTNYDDKSIRIFSPNSLLRNGGDDDLPPPNEPPKNTLLQFGSVTAHSPERSKSVKNRNTTLTTKPSTKKKKEKNHHEIDIKSDDDKFPSVVVEMADNTNNHNGSNNLERSKSHKSRKSNNSKDNNNVNRLSGYSTSDMSKTISNNDISDRELSDNNNNNDNEFYSSHTKKHSRSSTSLHRSKSKVRNSVEESRIDRRSSNNHHNSSSNNNSHNNNRPHRRSTSKEDPDGRRVDRGNSRRRATSKGVEEDRDGHKIDRTNSRRHRSHSRTRKNSSPPPPASKSTSDLQRSLSTRTRQMDRDLTSKKKNSFSDDRESGKNNNVSSRSSSNLDKKKSIKHKDLISNADTESTTSSSDVPLGDRLPLAMLVTKLPPSGQSNSWKLDKVIAEEDDDTTPLGRIGSFGAASTSPQSLLLSTDKSSNKQSLEDDISNYYDSVLSEVLGITDYQNTEEDKISDDDYPIGKSLSNISKEKEKESGTISDEEIPIGQLRSG